MLRLTPQFRAVFLWRRLWIAIGLVFFMVLVILYSFFPSSSRTLSEPPLKHDFNEHHVSWNVGKQAKILQGQIRNQLHSLENQSLSSLLNQGQEGVQRILEGPHVQHFLFNLNISKSRISYVIEDSMYFQQLQHLANKTISYVKSIQPDYDVNARHCHCGKIAEDCRCCAKLAIKKLRMNQVACIHFAYVVKERALRTKILFNNVVVVEKLLSANTLPTLCAGNTLELCASFRNTTYSVDLSSAHKTSLKGCVDILVLLKARVIAAYPLGCFVAEGDVDSKDQKHKEYHVHMENWMP